MKRELARLRVNNNLNGVINKWNAINKDVKSNKEIFKKFINTYGNLGYAQLVRLKSDNGDTSRDFCITVEPKKENIKEYSLYLRFSIYNNKKKDGLNTNTRGTTIFGEYELNEFDKVWDEIERRNKLGFEVI